MLKSAVASPMRAPHSTLHVPPLALKYIGRKDFFLRVQRSLAVLFVRMSTRPQHTMYALPMFQMHRGKIHGPQEVLTFPALATTLTLVYNWVHLTPAFDVTEEKVATPPVRSNYI